MPGHGPWPARCRSVALVATRGRRRSGAGPSNGRCSRPPRNPWALAELWRLLGEERGTAGRGALWAHPDLMPAADLLDDPAAPRPWSAPSPASARTWRSSGSCGPARRWTTRSRARRRRSGGRSRPRRTRRPPMSRKCRSMRVAGHR
ncbi:zinc-dependent metalloprotease [Pseudonocardia sp. H11422]|uniref:zinc-dependent metalloprotease n=1 Tax=Pseudonocardia sp. H11422 TaxID=2835866 RepID=UPI001BDD9EB5|nr:zinc-dependent metalloprotease [Pseudonocardia sp. H11422]